MPFLTIITPIILARLAIFENSLAPLKTSCSVIKVLGKPKVILDCAHPNNWCRSEVQLISEGSESSDEQSKGIDQINMPVAQMDKVTQQNASSAEESDAASEELPNQARYIAQCKW